MFSSDFSNFIQPESLFSCNDKQHLHALRELTFNPQNNSEM